LLRSLADSLELPPHACTCIRFYVLDAHPPDVDLDAALDVWLETHPCDGRHAPSPRHVGWTGARGFYDLGPA
jgi:hypothetical protein